MTANAKRFIELLAIVRETSYQDGVAMTSLPHEYADVTRQACKDANYALITHLRSMTEEDLKSL